MRICVPVPCFFGNMDFCEAIEKIADLGFDAIETYNWKNLDLDKVRAAMTNPEKRALSEKAAEKSLTLLKNSGILPLSGKPTLAVIGPHTDSLRYPISGYSYPAYLEMIDASRSPQKQDITIGGMMDESAKEETAPGYEVKKKKKTSIKILVFFLSKHILQQKYIYVKYFFIFLQHFYILVVFLLTYKYDPNPTSIIIANISINTLPVFGFFISFSKTCISKSTLTSP